MYSACSYDYTLKEKKEIDKENSVSTEYYVLSLNKIADKKDRISTPNNKIKISQVKLL